MFIVSEQKESDIKEEVSGNPSKENAGESLLTKSTKETITDEETQQIQQGDAAQLQRLRQELGIEESDVASLRNELREIFTPDFNIAGHGTTLGSADQILQEGILTGSKDSWDTSMIPIDLSDKSLRMILNWPHKKAKAIIVVMVPPMPDDMKNQGMGVERYVNSIFQEVTIEERGYHGFTVPPKYLRGYINVETKKFIPNALFDPEIPQPQKQVSHLEFIEKKITDKPVEVPVPQAQGDISKEEDVW